MDVMSEIVKSNIRREHRTLSKFACKSAEGVRRYPGRKKVSDRENIRPVFFHDTDKIIHSLAYSRYIDKTQVFFLFENDHIPHRVLHVQFVSKIARVIGRCLQLNEDLIEAIALGHDLGHVPYGHDGESYLNKICEENGLGHFSHNLQSARFLMEIENEGKGLNLTLQVLDGILSHNGESVVQKYEPDYNKTWDTFLDEYNNCWKVKNFCMKIRPMTLEGCAVKVSDVIAYVGRDIEDAITVKMIKREDIPTKITAVLGDTNDQIINNLAVDVIKNSYGKDSINFSKPVCEALKSLVDFNYKKIYLNPSKQTENIKIKNMFDHLYKDSLQQLNLKNKNSSIYKWHLDYMGDIYLQSNSKERIAVDYIAGMTDDFFNNEFKQSFLPNSFGMCLSNNKVDREELGTWDSRSNFSYEGSVEKGTVIYYGNNRRVNISSEEYSNLIKHFKGRTVAIGTSRTSPPKDSLGSWIKENTAKPAIASCLGPILINEGYAEKVGRSEIVFY